MIAYSYVHLPAYSVAIQDLCVRRLRFPAIYMYSLSSKSWVTIVPDTIPSRFLNANIQLVKSTT